jgi:hypothetical protein
LLVSHYVVRCVLDEKETPLERPPMKLHRLSTAVALTLTMASLALGCAGAADESEEDGIESGEDGLTQRQLPGVVAMTFESRGGTKTIGSAEKVGKAMKALARRGGSTPRCAPGPATKITFFDKDAKTIATGSFFCFLGSVTPTNGGPAIRFQTRPGGLDVLNEPLVPADALWGVTKIDIERRASIGAPVERLEVTQANAISNVLAAYDIDQTIDLRYSGTRCPPSHILTFRRGNNEVAQSSYVCGSSGGDLPASVTALFTIPGAAEAEPLARGGVKIDPRPIEQLLSVHR